jgi:hypothetical protein
MAGAAALTVLNKPFGEVSAEIGLGKRFTQKGMRRTFQDLARGAGLREEVQKRICGHITDEMKERYSTVGQGEQREAIGKVLGLMGSAGGATAPANDETGAPGGAPSTETGAPARKALGFLGASGRIRTCDLRLRRPSLYPAELRTRTAPS